MLAAMAFVLTAFEWRTFYETPTLAGHSDGVYLEDEVVLNAFPKEKPAPPPPPPRPVVDEFVYTDATEPDEPELFLTDIEMPPDIHEIEPVVEQVMEEYVWGTIDESPEFPGGDEGLSRYLASNIQYPAMAKDAGVQGKVYVTFLVSKTGEVTEVEVVGGIGAGCDEEAARVVSSMPLWKPGKQRGYPVNVRYYLPIHFKLRN
jgi:protein TonB